jgi:nicotinamidase-related amidase
VDALKTRHQNILDVEHALLVVVDVQERFRGHIDQYDNLIGSVATLVRGVERLAVPVLVTEQYPRGLGKTVKEISGIEAPDSVSSEHLREVLEARRFFEKDHFSAAVAGDFLDTLKAHGRNQIIVCGIEAHVCVNQTVHDLLNLGYQVHVVVDAVASRTPVNKENGLAKMFASGAIPATVEMVLFELLVRSGTAQFKQVQCLVK